MPHLFDPLTIRETTFKNRAWVSPMCMYSSVDGLIGEFHHAHLGAFTTGGAGLVFVEATGVVSEGRISVGCPGLWTDEQAQAFSPIIKLAHENGVKMGIQLAHAGRKGGTTLPGLSDHLMATQAEGGFQIVGPSPVAFEGYDVPRELTVVEIKQLVKDWADAAVRAVNAGFDVMEIHAAHGYLLHQFYSPLSNQRTDEYGGSFENRTRFLQEVVVSVRNAIPEGMPLFVRISASDWTDGGWTIEDSIQLVPILKNLGADLIDTSSGGNVHNAKITVGPGYQVHFAEAIKGQTGITTSAVGMITDPVQADEIISSGKADAIMMAREFLRNPRWPLMAAQALGVEVEWPRQLSRGKLAK
jgi:2,4-dienoyl-CoA reductase-like NADH-dependent reductase (Old Yellow Enzyme family)